jgi:phosphatidylethanolamine-binding protein (PEBP) family uncharacterized protein
MRRPGENPVVYAIAAVLGRLLRSRHAGPARSVLTLLPAPETIRLTSESFAEGAEIPDRHAGAGRGPNLSPQLSWTGVPDGTRQLLLVMEDPDVPRSSPALHLVAAFAPDAGPFAEGGLAPGAPGIRYLTALPLPGALGRLRPGYHGPRALPTHGPHAYDFVLLALDRPVPEDVERVADADGIVAIARDHVLARGRLRGIQIG